MEVAEQRMQRPLSKDVEKKNGKFGKFSTEGGSKFLCQIGEGGSYEFLRRTREKIN